MYIVYIYIFQNQSFITTLFGNLIASIKQTKLIEKMRKIRILLEL